VYRLSIAYLLWFLSGFGAMGFHRFYLGRFGIGAIFDFFYLPTMVRDENLKLGYRQAVFPGFDSPPPETPRVRESLEKVILRTARANKGVTTSAEVALEGDIPLEEARKALEKLVSGGHAEMRVRRNSGVIAYVFPEFLEDQGDFEEL
jgi:hypothetical protein